MFTQADRLHERLQQYGLISEEATIYLYVLQNGFQSALTISRALHLGRTKVYGILDKLKAKGLINHRLGSRGLEFGSLSYRQLEFLLIEKEKELQSLKQSTPILFEQLEKLVPFTSHPSQVLYYTGREGLEQITWNSTKAKDQIHIYEVEKSMDAFLDHKTAELMRRRFVENKVHIQQLTNSTYIPPYTNIKEKVKYYWQVRHLPPEELRISFEVMIYNDVYAMYSFQGNDVFCVEIYNDHLAEMQKELFDFVWQHAKPMNILSERGEAKLII